MTIYDIAKKAGVSVSTVSRVLNGKSNVSEALREQVQKVLDENHYTPSAIARGLANSSAHLIGVLTQDIRNRHHADMAYVIEQDFARWGYGCILCNTGTSLEMQSVYLRMMAERKVDGVILLGSIFQTTHIQQEIAKYLSSVPVVLINGYLPLENMYSVISDEYGAVKEAIRHFAERGHSQIGFILDRITASNNLKKQGYLDGMKECGLPCDKSNMIIGAPPTYEGGYTYTAQLLEMRPDITAILYTEDPIAVGGLKYCHDHSIAVPEELEIIGFNNSDIAEASIPELSSIDNQKLATGTEAAHILHDLLLGRERPQKMLLSANVVYRQTSPK